MTTHSHESFPNPTPNFTGLVQHLMFSHEDDPKVRGLQALDFTRALPGHWETEHARMHEEKEFDLESHGTWKRGD